MTVEIGDPGMQTQEFLSAFLSSEALLTALLSSCGPVFLLNNIVAPGCGDDVLMVDVSQAQKLPDGRPVTLELISMNDLWNVVFTEQTNQKCLRGLGIAVTLEEDVEHETVLIYCSPEPVSDAIDRRANLILSANSNRVLNHGFSAADPSIFTVVLP